MFDLSFRIQSGKSPEGKHKSGGGEIEVGHKESSNNTSFTHVKCMRHSAGRPGSWAVDAQDSMPLVGLSTSSNRTPKRDLCVWTCVLVLMWFVFFMPLRDEEVRLWLSTIVYQGHRWKAGLVKYKHVKKERHTYWDIVNTAWKWTYLYGKCICFWLIQSVAITTATWQTNR